MAKKKITATLNPKFKQAVTSKRREFAKKVSEMARVANKRLQRLEKNSLESLPAYKQWVQHGAIKFSVKGKDYNQLQSEYWRIKHFLDSETSTIKGAMKYLDTISQTVDITFATGQSKALQLSSFFALAEELAKNLDIMGEHAKALDYRAIWDEINKYVEDGNNLVMESIEDMKKATENIAKAMAYDYVGETVPTIISGLI